MIESTSSPQRSSTVVSVRLDTETIAHLDRLTKRTSRSLGLYLKAVIPAMLPTWEENYWTQQDTAYEESVIDREFRIIMDHALGPEDPVPETS